MKGCPYLIGGMTYSNPLRVFRHRWLLCLVRDGCPVASYLPDLVSVDQIAVETVVSSSELLRGVAGAVSFAARDIARLAFSFGLA